MPGSVQARAGPEPCLIPTGPALLALELSQALGLGHLDPRPRTPAAWRGNTELLILSLVEHEPRHGYELSKLIEARSRGVLTLHVASLYPLLYRLEWRGWIEGRWVEKAGQRRRRFYRLTPEGRKVLAAQRRSWREFVQAMNRIVGVDHA